MNLRDYIRQAGYDTVDPGYYERIAAWESWYRGRVRGFHDYRIFNRGKSIHRQRASLNMAKAGCEAWANLLWNDECAVNLGGGADDRLVNDILHANDFTRQASVLIERSFALGSGAFVAYRLAGAADVAGSAGTTGGSSAKRTRIDYVTALQIYPLAWRNDEIESCAFAGAYNDGRRRLLYLMIHEMQPDGTYIVYNRFFEQQPGTDQITPTATPQGIYESYRAKERHFAIVKPNLVNNAADVPLGLSVYANCIDTLKCIDLAYDGAKTAMEIGRPRIGVSSNGFAVSAVDGEMREVFDANDIAVYDIGQGGSEEKVVIEDLTTPYRATDFEQSLQTQLTIYAQCIGLGEKAFQWRRESVKTATEVISNDSTMLRAMEKHQQGLRSAIERLVRAVLDINGRPSDRDVEIVFDDSVTRDKAREAQEAWQWVMAGKYPFWRYLVDFQGYDEAEAQAIEGEAAGQSSMFGDDDDAGDA